MECKYLRQGGEDCKQIILELWRDILRDPRPDMQVIILCVKYSVSTTGADLDIERQAHLKGYLHPPHILSLGFNELQQNVPVEGVAG